MKTIQKLIALCAIGYFLAACTNSSTNKISRDAVDGIAQDTIKEDIKNTDNEEITVSARFKDEAGNPVNTAELKGKVVFINFWATWCPPCRKEMPSIQALYDKFKTNENIVFLIVEIEHDVEGTKKFLADQNLSLPIYYPEGDIPQDWLGGAIPTTVILDKTGKLAAKQEGMYDFSTKSVEDFIQNLINQ
ncbi:TlpA family protein disulfide reductase [Parapedobacter sp. SGR-10]|uniref:TlpA family protein disulfide reductase n=1 Tax=Parapedobacter sp. SGR-10 TaxID=2710879 RepID=UPI0013D63459|nr:TlpA disulfide reductase family protein [Parapedobacter sp. SGR-10]NGF56165.1 TlpA family protein disulfide reductase [Parapedobacter sp. SGR-10]